MSAKSVTAFCCGAGAAAALTVLAAERRRSNSSTRVHAGSARLPRATIGEALRLFFGVFIPTAAKGIILRRPRVVGMAERLDLDGRAVRIIQKLRDKYEPGPLLVGPVAGRRWAIVLQPEHVRRVLAETPEPFATVTAEKRAALAHFEPEGVLISHGSDRADRRRFNEQALDYGRSVHRLGDAFSAIVRHEASRLVSDTAGEAGLTWNRFAASWFRIVRLAVFGEGAREDPELSRVMARLRAHANWAWLWPKQPALRQRLYDRINAHLLRAEPGTTTSVAGNAQSFLATVPITAAKGRELSINATAFRPSS